MSTEILRAWYDSGDLLAVNRLAIMDWLTGMVNTNRIPAARSECVAAHGT